MSKKLYLGITAGLLAGLAIPMLLKFRREGELFSDEDLTYGDNIPESTNHKLLKTRNKVDKMISKAERKSELILKEAAGILALAKEKTAAIHYGKIETAKTELSKIREEIEEMIDRFNRSKENK